MLDQGNNNRAGEGDGYRALNNLRIDADLRFVDTRDVALSIPELKSHSLTAVAEHYGIATQEAHRAKSDAMVSGQILLKIYGIPGGDKAGRLMKKGCQTR